MSKNSEINGKSFTFKRSDTYKTLKKQYKDGHVKPIVLNNLAKLENVHYDRLLRKPDILLKVR